MSDTTNPKIHRKAKSGNNSILIAMILIVVAAIIALSYMLWEIQQNPPIVAKESTGLQATTRYEVSADNDPSIGPADAQITIIEFSDFECPYCTKWHNEVWPRIQEEYPDQVRLVYRDFPLNIHSSATLAAEAANCAGEQGAYWEYHDALFRAEHGLGQSAFKEYAQELGLVETDFNQCLDSHRYQEEVQADFNYAVQLGVKSTPTFFINGITLIGAQPFEAFQNVIERELAGENPE
jgi:protein-disulfide isomerase